MSNKHHYTGLTGIEVEKSRKKYGANILTPPEKETFWDTLKDVLKHWISISLAVLTVGSLAAAVFSGGHFIMPAVLFVSWLLIVVVGFFGGFGDPLFKILITAFVLSMGISIYEFEGGGAGFSTFFEPVGIIVALLLATSRAFLNISTFPSFCAEVVLIKLI